MKARKAMALAMTAAMVGGLMTVPVMAEENAELLPGGGSKIIYCITPSTSNPFFNTEQVIAKEKAEELGYEVKCASHDDDAATQLELFEAAINDGAAALVIMSEEKAKELGVKPLATWVAGALAGVEPEVMGLGPIAATKKVMAKTGLTVADMDLVEANEAFAAQSIAVGEALGFDKDKLNVNGGAIALGHPVGASGARILVTLLYAMKHRGAHKGLATLCIGGGMGCATIVEMD